MQLEKLKAEEIRSYSYNELIGLVRETNRPPGGSTTIASAARAGFLSPGRKMLEIGTATGITAIEMAQMTGCTVTAIDINPASLEEASRRAKIGKVDHLVTFQKDDATKLSFSDETFDVVFCGNVTSLVSNRESALKEYARVLKPGGLLLAVPMYYIKEPSDKLVQDVRDAIQVNITPHKKEYWTDFFVNDNFKTLTCEDFAFRDLSEKKVAEFSAQILVRPHLDALSPFAKKALEEVYTDYMELFRINLAHMGYSVLTLMKIESGIDRELFVADPVK